MELQESQEAPGTGKHLHREGEAELREDEGMLWVARAPQA
jgi:hypothetical protein